MLDKLKAAWEYVQDFLDLDGDCVMAVYTGCVIYKTLHGGLNPSDAAAYAAAIGAFGYSNTHTGKPS